jgi:FkbM family methyltransferase
MSIRRRSNNPFRDVSDIVRFVWAHPSNKGRRAAVLARALRYQLAGRVLKRPTIVPIGERSRFVAYPSIGVSGLVYANPLEWREIAVWRRELRAGDLFVDVGANVGSYTLWACELGAQVVAIEPDPEFARMLRENLALNGFGAQVIEAALADRAGTARITTGGGVTNHLVLDATIAGTREVPVRTLDEIVGDRVAAGVKIDVEGAEALVLRGAQRALSEGRIRLLQMEWNSLTLTGETREETAAFLEGFGYRFFLPGDAGEEIPRATPGPTIDVFARAPER